MQDVIFWLRLLTKWLASSELYDAFDTIIDARGVYAGGWMRSPFVLIGLSSGRFIWNGLTEAQIHFDRSLGVNGYGWIFPVSALTWSNWMLGLGLVRWIPENKHQYYSTQFIQSNETTTDAKVVSQQPQRCSSGSCQEKETRLLMEKFSGLEMPRIWSVNRWGNCECGSQWFSCRTSH